MRYKRPRVGIRVASKDCNKAVNMNAKAKLINEKLDVKLYNEQSETLELNKFTKKQVKDLLIDDLVCMDTLKPTARLNQFVAEILGE